MKTYKELIERAFSARGQAAREKMRSQEGLNAARKAADRQQQAAKVGISTPSQQKALPPAKSSAIKPSPGGSLSTKAADKGSAIVRQKSSAITPSKPGALATQKPNKPGDNSNKMGRTPNPYRYGQPPDKPQQKPKKPKKDKKKKGPSLLTKAGNFLKPGLNNTVGDGQPESSRGSIEPPKRGVYNG